MADGLRGEEGLEDPCLRGHVHPHAVVAHVEPHVFAGCRRHSPPSELVAQRDVARRDGDPPAGPAGDRIPRVDGEVEDDLLHLPRIGVHEPERRIEPELQLAPFADEQAEHPLEIAHARVEVDPLGAQQLPPAEREQLGREPRGAVRRLHDLVDELVRFFGRLDRHLQQRGEALDRREQVVEVVRHAPREQPDRFHLLCRAQLGLEPPLLGHVAPIHRHHLADEFRVDLVPASLLGFMVLEVD